MAPSAPLGGPILSTTSASIPLVFSVIIIVSSVVGASSVLVIVVLAFSLRRRGLAVRHHAKEADSVPKLVITDTSMFPASNVVVDEDALDKVIASHKPFGSETPGSEELPVIDICDSDSSRDLGEDEESTKQNIALLVSSGPDSEKYVCSGPEGTAALEAGENGTNKLMTIPHRDSMILYNAGNTTSSVSSLSRPEGVWWYEFHLEEDEDTDSQSENSEIGGTDSIHSSISDVEAAELTNLSTKLPLSSADRLAQVVKDETVTGCNVFSTRSDEDSSQDTMFDKQILEYCWQISEDMYSTSGQDERLASTCDALESEKEDEKTMIEAPDSVVQKSHSADESIDFNILDYYWRITGQNSVKGLDDLCGPGSVTMRFTTAARSVSDASVSGLAQHHDPGHLVYSQSSRFRKNGVRDLLTRDGMDDLFAKEDHTQRTNLKSSIRKGRTPLSSVDSKLNINDGRPMSNSAGTYTSERYFSRSAKRVKFADVTKPSIVLNSSGKEAGAT
ncbi:hypothetical protein DFH11DRAFT_1731886 [Phellopilus nigrolimitatus]|nr:hypothetical protein DFH11DRAFT_1731886 [Phellopilus nigrolimitatus]